TGSCRGTFGVMRSYALLALLIGACGGDKVDREVGARCEVETDCVDRCLGPNGDYPEGFCSIDCVNNRDCPDDASCVDREGGVCLFNCGDNADCNFLGQGWFCENTKLRETDVKVGVCRGG